MRISGTADCSAAIVAALTKASPSPFNATAFNWRVCPTRSKETSPIALIRAVSSSPGSPASTITAIAVGW